MSIELTGSDGRNIPLPLFAANNEITSIKLSLGSARVELSASKDAIGQNVLCVMLTAGLQNDPLPQGSCTPDPTTTTNTKPLAFVPFGVEGKGAMPSRSHSLPGASSRLEDKGANRGSSSSRTIVELEDVQNSPPLQAPIPNESPESRLVVEPVDNTEESRQKEWLKKMKGWFMVVATQIAAVAYQAGINLPGGLWQDDGAPPPSGADQRWTHSAGQPIMRDKNARSYMSFKLFNLLALMSSLAMVMLLMRESVFHWERQIRLLRMLIAASVLSLGTAYLFSYPSPVGPDILVYSITAAVLMMIVLCGIFTYSVVIVVNKCCISQRCRECLRRVTCPAFGKRFPTLQKFMLMVRVALRTLVLVVILIAAITAATEVSMVAILVGILVWS